MQGRNIPWTRWVLHARLGWATPVEWGAGGGVRGGGLQTDTRMWAFGNTALHSSWLQLVLRLHLPRLLLLHLLLLPRQLLLLKLVHRLEHLRLRHVLRRLLLLLHPLQPL